MNERSEFTDPEADHTAFEEQERALRRLARHLVGGLDAEDLVQDTWLAALESGWRPSLARPAWLRGVLRKKALMVHRTRGRRLEREARAREEPPGAEVAMDVQRTRERLIEAVTALCEPERAAVRLRYLEGLSVAGVARRLGRPRDTIKGQLKRGLAMLRRDFELRSGDEDARLALVLFARGPGRLTSSMSLVWVLASTTLVLVLGLLAWWGVGGAGASEVEAGAPLVASGGGGREPATGLEGAANTDPATPEVRVDARRPPPVASAGEAPPAEAVSWSVRVLDPGGAPLAGATVFVNGRALSAVSDEAGVAVLKTLPGARNELTLDFLEGRVTFFAEHPDYLRSHHHHVDPQGLAAPELGIRFEHRRELVRGRVRWPDRRPVAAARIGLYDQGGAYTVREDGVVLTTSEETCTSGTDGSFAVAGRIAPGYLLRVEHEAAAPFVAETGEIPEEDFGLDVEIVEGVTLAGLVRSQEGEPVAGARVSFSTEHGTFRHDAICDEKGNYSARTLPTGPLTLWAVDPVRADTYASTQLEVRYGEELHWSPTLVRHPAFRVRVLDETGEPLEHFLCHLALEDWFVSRETDSGGWTLPFASYPDVPTAILVHDPEDPLTMPLLFLDDQVLDGDDVELRLPSGARQRAPIHGTLAESDGRPLTGEFSLFLYFAAERMGMPYFETDPGTGGFRTEPQPPGDYVLAVFLGPRGVHFFPPFHLAPGEPVDLETLYLPVPGSLVLEIAGGAEPDDDLRISLEYVHQTGAHQTYHFASTHAPRTGTVEAELLPGEYRARAWRGQREVGAAIVTVHSERSSRETLTVTAPGR